MSWPGGGRKPPRDPIPTVDLDLIRKIEAVALDDRGDPRTREIALDKLGAFKISHPHLFSEPYRVEDDANPWSDVADVGVEESPPWPPAPSDKDRARFLDINRWRRQKRNSGSAFAFT